MMRPRKLLVTVATFAAIALMVALWPKPKAYTYQGRTVEQWFRNYVKDQFRTDQTQLCLGQDAFKAMGTNAVPYLASRINKDISPWLEFCTSKLPKPLRPMDRHIEPLAAADLLINWIKPSPPRKMLEGLLAPAMVSRNSEQSNTAHFVLLNLPKAPLP